MASFKRVFDPLDLKIIDPLDLKIIDLVFEAALVQLAARDPLSDH